MGPVLVGDPGCDISQLALEITKPPSDVIVLQSWSKLAMALDIPYASVEILRKDLLLSKILIIDVVAQLLTIWRCRHGVNATFSRLVDILEDDCGYVDISDNLLAKFCLNLPRELCWINLHQKTHRKFLKTEISILGNIRTLLEHLSFLNDLKMQTFLDDLPEEAIRELLSHSNHLEIPTHNPPDIPDYYIPRTISRHNVLKRSVFQQDIPDKFVLLGVSLSELSDLAGNESVDKSWPHKPQYLSRFIKLFNDEDYDYICRVAEDNPVHLIKHADNKHVWLRSHGTMTNIRDHLESFSEPITENDIIWKSDKQLNHSPVVISDYPGMGKSSILANLCRSTNGKHLNLFLTLPDLIFTNMGDGDAKDPLKQLVSYSTTSMLGRHMLWTILKEKSNLVNIFFDAFDEISDSMTVRAMNFLKLISLTNHKNVYVTTRSHRVKHLEDALNTIAYEIHPLERIEMRNLILGVWHEMSCLKNPSVLSEFADQIIDVGLKQLDSKEATFAGIPLQCRMLAEVYLEDAKLHSRTQGRHSGVHLQTFSMYELFNTLIRIKFKAAKKETREYMKIWHILVSINYLFPERENSLIKTILQSMHFININDVNRIGICVCAQDTKIVRFVHRSYAEFFVGSWICEENKNEIFAGENNLKMNVLLKDVLSPVPRWSVSSPYLIRDIGPGVFYKFCVRSCIAEQLRETSEEIMRALNIRRDQIDEAQTESIKHKEMNVNESYQRFNDILYCMIWAWTDRCRTPRPLAQLTDALNACNLQPVSDIIVQQYSTPEFAFHTVAFFINAGLSKITTCNIKCSTISCWNFQSCIETSIRHDYQHLLRLVTTPFFDEPGKKLTEDIHSVDWTAVVIEACKFSSLELLQYLFRLMHTVEGMKPITPTFKTKALRKVAARGSFTIFDYLVKQLKPELEDLKEIFHICVHNTVKLDKSVIDDKLNIMAVLMSYHPSLINQKEKEYLRTPLQMQNIHFRLIYFLLLNGCDWRATDRFGETAAHRAARFCSPEEFYNVCQLFISNGMKEAFTFGERWNYKPLHMALRFNTVREDTIRLLSAESAVDFGDEIPYISSAIVGKQKIEVIMELVKAGANPFEKHSNDKHTHLHHAANMGHIDAIRYFVSVGISVNCKDHYKRTPLHRVFSYRNNNIHGTVQELLYHNAKPNKPNFLGNTPLHYAKHFITMGQVQERTLALLQSESQRRRDR